MWLVFVMYALFASCFTAAKEALYYADPFFLVGSRMIFSGVLMVSWAALKNRSSLSIPTTAFFRIFLLGLFNIYLTNILELWGLKYLTSFKTCFIYSLSPFVAALLSYMILSEILTPRKWLGLIIGFIGFIPILAQQNRAEAIIGQIWFLSWPELAVLGAVFSTVIGWIVFKQLVTHDNCSPIVANGYSMFLGGLFATIHSLFCEKWTPIPVRDYSVWIQTAIFLTIVSNIICYNLYGYLLKRFSPTFMSFAGLSTPLFTALFGWIFLNEMVTASFFISLAIVFIGLLIFYYEEVSQGKKEAVEVIKEAPTEVLLPRSTHQDEYL